MIRLRKTGDVGNAVGTERASTAIVGETPKRLVGHRQFLKMLAGAAGLAGVAELAAPRAVQATYTPGTPDVVNTDLAVQGNLSVASLSTPKNVEVAGTVRTTSTVIPTSGVGVEVCYLDGQGYVVAYDRGTSTWRGLDVSGSKVTLCGCNGSGNVGIGIWSPSAKLHLGSGEIKIGSKIIADSSGSFYA